MKRLYLLAGLCASLALAALPTTQIGCSSVERTAYQAVGATQVSVDVAMAVWNDYVKAGKASVTQEMQVKKAYEQYQLAAFIVIDTAKATNSKTNSAALNQVLASASTSLANLVTLIRSFGAKI